MVLPDKRVDSFDAIPVLALWHGRQDYLCCLSCVLYELLGSLCSFMVSALWGLRFGVQGVRFIGAICIYISYTYTPTHTHIQTYIYIYIYI